MATEEDLEKAKDETADEADESEDTAAAEESAEAGSSRPPASGRTGDALEVRSKSKSTPPEDEAAAEVAEEEEDAGAAAPMQLGYMRFVYAAYMAGAMVAAFLVAKIGHVAWYRLGQWKPDFGEPRDELLYPVAAVVGVLVSLYYWKKPESRKYTMEVAEELSKVTWPDRKEVVNSTFVTIVTTVFAVVYFALMDQFWKYVTDKIYSF